MAEPLDRQIRKAALFLMGATTAAADQASSMTDKELGEALLAGRWTTIEIHEAGQRLIQRASSAGETPDG